MLWAIAGDVSNSSFPGAGIEPLSWEGEGSTVKPSDLRKDECSEPASSNSEAAVLATSFHL